MDPLAPLITALHSEGRLRVWSLVITAFGDLVQHRGGRISTARLGLLLGRVGVEPGTLRTALSRLGRDGWVESERKGRTSLYRLSTQGLDRFAPATTRIYGVPRTKPVGRWSFSLSLNTSGEPDIRILPEDESLYPADCRVTGELGDLSDAYRASLLSSAHRAALTALANDLGALDLDVTSPLDAAAARLLLIHRWRRIVLRFPDSPPELLPEDTPLSNPRLAVAKTYARLIPATETWLGSSVAGQSPMPAADSEFAKRFGGARST